MKTLKLTKLPLRHKVIILVSLATLVAVGSLSFILFPGQAALRSTQAAITDIQREQNLSGSSSSNLVRAKQRGAEISETENLFSTAFVPKNNPIYLIALIEELAEGRNITADISINDTRTESETATHTPVTIGLQLTGPLQAILEFLNDLSTSPILLDVKNITINTNVESTANSTDPTLSVNVQTITYWK